ncbi:hypothetical protein BU23DRAFT_521559 [Bimuria novae-zelandiae CBS 107.79]|uniref:Response regulatory domain-containing protein n=1 Tax=Bimuria novae-zelandiae CBS 107.79 TaxID=1447943 RepID=A0A6A5UGT2_9PLEO|nr:hypothetical protein BU23DRAFT_521559 [Bimuria novae-zelandiae CBS 107.79]
MTSIKSRFSHARSKLLRRQSHVSSAASQCSSADSEQRRTGSSLRKSISLSKLPAVTASDVPPDGEDQRLSQSESTANASRPETESLTRDGHLHEGRGNSDVRLNFGSGASTTSLPHDPFRTACPTVTIEEPIPVHPTFPPPPAVPQQEESRAGAADGLVGKGSIREEIKADKGTGSQLYASDGTEPVAHSEDHPSELPALASASRPAPLRRQSLVTSSNTRAIKTLLHSDPAAAVPNFSAGMLHRKIWVKRHNASATLVQIREDDLVDDVREMILKKYGNSLGRSFDAPDIILRILPRDTNGKGQERVLGPEEDMCRTLDAYFPGGQTVHEALIIDVPRARTPKPSPRVPHYHAHQDDTQQQQHQQTEYFPLMPIAHPSPAASHEPRASLPHAPHSITVLQTGVLPPLPSPGGNRRIHANRPKYPRQNTASPTGGVPQSATSSRPPGQRVRHDSSASETKHSTSSNQPIPTPPAPPEPNVRQNSNPSTPRISSPKPGKSRKKPRAIEVPTLPPGLLDNSVPPINVLIVEDNIINLRVLGAFMQRLKVRWQRAMNGKEAVEKWRAGGFHLVLMDIQLPIMDGLEATREIRRLERINSIGVFSSGSSEAPNTRLGNNGVERELQDDDKLGDKNMFKSPVIIVALTASSLQSDRHEALAAGCNDFLTKPVNFVWLERKVKEWGCMQALIDFDGWRRWKDFTSSDTTDGTSKLSTSYSSVAPRRGKATQSSSLAVNTPNGQAGPSTTNGNVTKPKEETEKKSKRKSMGVVPPPVLPEEESATSTPDVDSGGN